MMIRFWIFLCATCFSLACNKSNEEKSPEEVITTPLTSGTIQFGIYSNGIELGSIVEMIDFSREDVKSQFETALNQMDSDKNPFLLIQHTSQQDPLLALTLMLNVHHATLYIKNEEVLAKIKGLGWNMEHYHHESQDIGKIFIETLSNSSLIPADEKQIYTTYQPSSPESQNTTIDLNNFTRSTQSQKENILGYACDISIYSTDVTIENSISKIVVFSSPLIHKTINFTHPYYLPEEGGILRLDVYLNNATNPSFSMKPKQIQAIDIKDSQVSIQTSPTVYDYTDPTWALKSFELMMAGWNLLAQ